jgi:RNA polymerase sigma-32 factor
MSVDKNSQRLIERARQAPKLSWEEERACIRAWQSTGDRRAAGRVIEANLRHVVFTALKFKNYGIPVGDLISEGNIGLMKALERFDETRNVRFATYANYWVRAQIVMGVLDSWSMLSGPRGALDSRVFFRLRRERAKLVSQTGQQTSPDALSVQEQLATQFGVSERRMEEMLSQLDSRGVSLDATGPGNEHRLLDDLALEAEQSAGLEWREQSVQLERILDRVRDELDPREAFILERRLMADREDKLSLGQIGQHFGVSRERIRQIEVRAQRKLKSQALQEELVGETRSPRRVSTHVEEVPSAECPIGPGSKRPSKRSGCGEPGTSLVHEVLGSGSCAA